MIRKASAAWKGTIKEGQGTISTGSGALKDLKYNFRQRFEDAPGTNPEELLGAAHSACYAMALSLFTSNAGYTLENADVTANVTLDAQGGGFTITKVHLDVVAKIPGVSAEAFQKIAEDTKKNCPVSKVLNAEITLAARLA